MEQHLQRGVYVPALGRGTVPPRYEDNICILRLKFTSQPTGINNKKQARKRYFIVWRIGQTDSIQPATYERLRFLASFDIATGSKERARRAIIGPSRLELFETSRRSLSPPRCSALVLQPPAAANRTDSRSLGWPGARLHLHRLPARGQCFQCQCQCRCR